MQWSDKNINSLSATTILWPTILPNEISTNKDGNDRNMLSITKFNYGGPTRQLVTKNIGSSDYIGVEKIDPQANQVTLKNGRVIEYENLVVAMGQK